MTANEGINGTLDDGLLAHYPLETNLSDISGNGNDLLSEIPAVFDNALVLDGITDYAIQKEDGIEDSPEWSISFFFMKEESQSDIREIISCCTAGRADDFSDIHNFAVRYVNKDYVEAAQDLLGIGCFQGMVSNSVFDMNVWDNYIITFSSNIIEDESLKVYKNGTQVSGISNIAFDLGYRPFFIGSRGADFLSTGLSGKFLELRFYNRILTGDEITEIVTMGTDYEINNGGIDKMNEMMLGIIALTITAAGATEGITIKRTKTEAEFLYEEKYADVKTVETGETPVGRILESQKSNIKVGVSAIDKAMIEKLSGGATVTGTSGTKIEITNKIGEKAKTFEVLAHPAEMGDDKSLDIHYGKATISSKISKKGKAGEQAVYELEIVALFDDNGKLLTIGE